MSEPGGMDEAFLAAVIEAIAHPVFVKDRAFRFVLVNRALCEMVGLSREAMIGRTDHDFFPREEADFFRLKDTEALSAERAVSVSEETITDAHGVTHTLSTTKVPLRGPDGAVTHLVGIIHEITALKEAAEVLQRTNEILEDRVRERTEALEAAQSELVRRERLAVLGQFAGGVAHQIRNPLGSIKNAAYLVKLALRPAPPEDVVRALDIIHDEVGRANQIITDLMEYARVSPPSRRRTTAAFLVEQALDGLGEQDVTVDVDVPEALPDLDVDPLQVQRALQNLADNALQAMTGGGRLGVRASLAGDFVRVEVSDTGPGIAPEVRHRLFEPLVSTYPGALGLGLITAKALIEANGGALEVSSSDARGTTFSFTLPVAAGA
ncbi:MAG: PAS domain S-box protein [Polyangiales bacterium]